MQQFRYGITRVSELVTNIKDPSNWVVDQMNKVGAEGKRVIAAPVEFQEPGTVVDAKGNAIPYYGVILFTEEPIEVEAA